jgi:hypothetical protein
VTAGCTRRGGWRSWRSVGPRWPSTPAASAPPPRAQPKLGGARAHRTGSWSPATPPPRSRPASPAPCPPRCCCWLSHRGPPCVGWVWLSAGSAAGTSSAASGRGSSGRHGRSVFQGGRERAQGAMRTRNLRATVPEFPCVCARVRSCVVRSFSN